MTIPPITNSNSIRNSLANQMWNSTQSTNRSWKTAKSSMLFLRMPKSTWRHMVLASKLNSNRICFPSTLISGYSSTSKKAKIMIKFTLSTTIHICFLKQLEVFSWTLCSLAIYSTTITASETMFGKQFRINLLERFKENGKWDLTHNLLVKHNNFTFNVKASADIGSSESKYDRTVQLGWQKDTISASLGLLTNQNHFLQYIFTCTSESSQFSCEHRAPWQNSSWSFCFSEFRKRRKT